MVRNQVKLLGQPPWPLKLRSRFSSQALCTTGPEFVTMCIVVNMIPGEIASQFREALTDFSPGSGQPVKRVNVT